jgi:outer membrane protein insertion porin family
MILHPSDNRLRTARRRIAAAVTTGGLAALLLPMSAEVPGAPWGGLRAQGVDQPEVSSLRFEGNESFSEEVLTSAILTRDTECRSVLLRPFCWAGAEFARDRRYLSPRVFRDDFVRIHLFYQQRGYRDVLVDTAFTTREDGSVDILVRVDEGEPHLITALEILGAESVAPPPIDEDLPISVGEPLDLVMLDVARDTLTRRLQNRGYAHAEVLRNILIPAGTREAEVEFDVYTGPVTRFGAIDIVGNDAITDRVVRRMLPFGEGGLYRRELLFDAQRNIYNLEIFSNASITEDLQNQPDSIVPLLVQVNEGDRRRVRAGGGWNTEECLTAEASWTHRNYFGGARRLVLGGRVSNLFTMQLEESVCSAAGTGVYGELDWVLSADFTQPFIFTPRNSLAVSVYAERQSLQNVFVREALGLTFALTRSVGRSTPLTLSYRPQLARLDAAEVFFCVSFFVCDPVSIELLQGSNLLSPVGLSLTRDRTNRVVSPTGGYRGLIDLETAAAWSGSDYRHERAVAELAGFFGLNNDLVLAGRIRAGWLEAGVFKGLSGSDSGGTQIAHPERRFYAGGSNSVRGYAQNQLGPQVVSVDVERLLLPQGDVSEAVCLPEEVAALSCSAAGLSERFFSARPTGGTRLVEGNVELRVALWGPLGGAAFVDFGRVWDPDNRVGESETVLTPGVGLRYTTPIGPIRIDLGYRGTPVRDVPVVTSQVRPFDSSVDDPNDRIGAGQAPEDVLEWVRLKDLALLDPLVRFRGGEGTPWWRGLQLHFSIGQAF